jgi:hypothetical protein
MSIMERIVESRSVRKGAFNGTWEGPFDVGIEEQGKTQRFERSQWRPEEAQAFNERLMAWGAKVNGSMPASISSHGIGGKRLRSSIRNNYYYEYGEIFRLGFSFSREGIFVHKGVGRGYRMNNGIVVKVSKTAGHNRVPKPWFNPVIESHMPEMEQIVVDYTKTAIVNSTRIYIR